MKAFYSFLLLVAVSLTACDEALTEKLIQLADGTSTSLVFDANSNGETTIKFTADAQWTASVNEVAVSKSGESISWLKLSSYAGNAGENSITISLLKNFTGNTRKAEVRIVCADSEVIISVEQKGDSSTGVVVKPVKKIVYTEDDNSSADTDSTPYEEEYTMEFSYDNTGRVARIIKNETDYNDDKSTITYNFNYDIVGEIQVEKVEKEDWDEYSETENYVVKLDDRGNATKVQKAGSSWPIAEFGYTDDVRLGKIVEYEYDNEVDYQDIFTYENGLMVKYTNISEYDDTHEITFDESYYTSKYPNNGMVDMMGFLNYEAEYDFLFYIGRIARTSDYFFEKVPFDDEDAILNNAGYQEEPGTILKFNYKSSRTSGDSKIKCEYDSEENLTKVQISYPYDVYDVYYEIRITNELFDPQMPELGYKGVYQNERETELSSGNDYETYTVSY